MLTIKHPDLSLIEIIKRRRGWNTDFFTELSIADDADLPGSDDACAIINRAIARGTRITIITDHDADGIFSGVTAYAGLSELGATASMMIPDYRGSRQITPDDIDAALSAYPDTGVILTCDSGINSNWGIDHAQAKGLEVIVTDHHLQETAVCPADAVVNPNRADQDDHPLARICGAQVVHRLLTDYARAHAPESAGAIAMLTVFAGMGSLTDVMPLTGVNRHQIRKALAMLRLAVPDINIDSWGKFATTTVSAADPGTSTLAEITQGHCGAYSRAFWGLSLLLRQLIGTGHPVDLGEINASFVGYTLGPMINAVRRVGGDMADIVNIFAPQLVEEQRDNVPSQIESIDTLIQGNEQRKHDTRAALARARTDDQPYAPAVYLVRDVKPGILGLLASRLREGSAAVAVLDATTLRGSARAVDGVDVLAIAENIDGATAQGHRQACGVVADDMNAVAALADAFSAATDSLGDVDDTADLHMLDLRAVAHLSADAIAHLTDQTDAPVPDADDLMDLINQLRAIEPFGKGFDYPDIRVSFRVAEANISMLGKAGRHIKIITDSGLELLWWNSADRYEELIGAEIATVGVELGVNDFLGTTRPQAIVNSVIFVGTRDIDDEQGAA